ncbi:hypothetical protein [Streptosporangium vulgare]|uniref:CopG family transcriptional regulator n=1 Tax=Streptosporangium vulgare TaxID=46190 RepID=A0ABV5TQ73_9ACTN
MTTDSDHTHQQRFRLPLVWWNTYKRVTDRLGTNRTARLLALIRDDIEKHGDEQDLEALAQGDAELAERRARKGGRPRKQPEE